MARQLPTFKGWRTVVTAAAVAWADWSVDLWAHCADCSLRATMPWFGMPTQLPLLAFALSWLVTGYVTPIARASGVGVAVGSVMAAATSLWLERWMCTPCVTIQLALLVAALLCPFGWRTKKHTLAAVVAGVFSLGLTWCGWHSGNGVAVNEMPQPSQVTFLAWEWRI